MTKQINTIFDNVRYNGVLLSKSLAMTSGEYGFYALRDFKILEVQTSTTRTKKQFMHGESIGETYNSARDIVIVFDIIAKDQLERFEAIKRINYLFAPPKNPSQYNQGRKRLEFTGPDGSERRCNAKVIERPVFSDYDNDMWITTTVKLVSKDNSNIYGSDKNTLTTQNSKFGVKIPMVIPYTYSFLGDNIDYPGPSDAPIDIEITALKDNATPLGYILVRNQNTIETLLTINITDFNTGDFIKIDSANSLVFLQKVGGELQNITGQTTVISEWPVLLEGDNLISVYNGSDTKDMNVILSYYNTWD